MADLEDFSLAEWDRICLDNLLSTSTDHVYFKDSCSRFIRVSTGVVDAATQPRAELRGMPVVGEADLLGRTDFDVFHDTSAQAAFDVEQGIIRTGAPVLEVIERQTWPDRPPTYVTTSKRPLRGPDGQIIGTFGISRDVTDDLLVRSQLESVLLTSPDAISRLDPQLRFVYVNPAAEDVFGLPAAQILGKTDEQLDDRGFFAEFWHATLRRVVDTGEPARLQHESGGGEDIRYFESHVVAELDVDVVTGVLVLTRDITDRRRAELAVAELALHDPLTGLANRVLLLDRLQQSLVRLERGTGMVAVLFLDLDRFKAVNDTWGHAFGDALLVETAERLLTCARRSDTVARLGGDEFVMVCDRISAVDDARVVADRLTSVLAMPFSYEGNTVSLSASIGIATAADPRTTADELIRNADVAMYQAKERGRGTGSSHLFDASFRDRSPSRQSLEYELGTALEEGQLSLHYQPLHDLGTGVVHGVEALVRWQHPSRGLLQPHDFMPVAERSGLVVPLGAWVLDEACRQLASWNAARAGKPPLTVSVNLSARQLSSPGNVDMVAATLARHHVPPALLCLEISETTLLEEAVSTPESLTALHGIGVLIALDSFGTGYSSLAHLRRFPVDIIKIDREFVSAISVTPQGSELAGAIAAMAHALGMKTVGEGVETAAQLAALQQFGCDDAQGFLLSRPMPAEELTALLAATP